MIANPLIVKAILTAFMFFLLYVCYKDMVLDTLKSLKEAINQKKIFWSIVFGFMFGIGVMLSIITILMIISFIIC